MSLHTIILDDQLKPAEVSFPLIQSQSTIENHWLFKVEENRDIIAQSLQNYSCLYTITNGPHTEISANPILQAFISAYNQHHDLILSPDDMWMLVCLQFAQCVNHNAEQLRSLFVEHSQGKIELTVSDFKREYEWDEFFDQMKVTIGTLDDWQSLRTKTEQLQCFGDNAFRTYVNGVLPIFDEFIQTYQGNVNKEFWIKVCDITRNPRMKYGGGGSGKLITGWLLQLFGLEVPCREEISLRSYREHWTNHEEMGSPVVEG
ncbi:unnamed protein product [Rotaria sp. Silwood1]|nr:unnamed protein product [Rotaria sp. Silwood1]